MQPDVIEKQVISYIEKLHKERGSPNELKYVPRILAFPQPTSDSSNITSITQALHFLCLQSDLPNITSITQDIILKFRHDMEIEILMNCLRISCLLYFRVHMGSGSKPWVSDFNHPNYEAGKKAVEKGKFGDYLFL